MSHSWEGQRHATVTIPQYDELHGPNMATLFQHGTPYSTGTNVGFLNEKDSERERGELLAIYIAKCAHAQLPKRTYFQNKQDKATRRHVCYQPY